jgi:hypothetical protein
VDGVPAAREPSTARIEHSIEATADSARPIDDRPSGARLKSTIETIASVIAPTTLIMALLYYFGWARATATYNHFGIDQSGLGFSIQDYLLRSTNSAFRPLSFLLLVGLLVGWLQVRLARTLEAETPTRLVSLLVGTARVVGALLLFIGLISRFGPVVYNIRFPVVPLSLASGVSLLVYAGWLGQRWEPDRGGSRKARVSPSWLPALRRGLVWAFVIVNLFAAVASYADLRGAELGRQLEAHLAVRPGVVLYSVDPLGLEGPGVGRTSLTKSASRFQFRYVGLKLIVRSGGKYFLVPAGWSSHNGASVFVIPDGDNIRVEFQPGSIP